MLHREPKNGSARSPQPSALVIRASEIGEYEYCQRAWWYKHVVKLDPASGEVAERLAHGTDMHARHGRGVSAAAGLRALGVALAICGALTIIVALLLAPG